MRRREISGERRRAARQESDAGQIHGAGQHIAAAREQRASEGGIEKVFLRQLPGDDFPHLRSVVAGRFEWLLLPLPGDRAVTELRRPGTAPACLAGRSLPFPEVRLA